MRFETPAAELTRLVAPIVNNAGLGIIVPARVVNAIDEDQLVFTRVAHRVVQDLQELMAIHHNGRISRVKLIENKH